jgi:hypothetical protein
VIWTRKPSRPPVRAVALATLTLVVAGLSANAASAATPAGATTPTTTYAPSGGATAPGGGATAPGGRAAAATPTSATTAPAATTPAQAVTPGKAASGGGDRPLSTGAIVIAALAALLVLGCLAWAFARSLAFEPHWLITLRHSAAEAGFRVSATWSELLDWARLGR